MAGPLVACIGLPAAAEVSPPAPAIEVTPSYIETFDGAPAVPEAFRSDGWDVTVHSRDVHTWYDLEPMVAEHGQDCGAPPAGHVTTSYADAVFRCRDHLMTAINAGGYGLIYLTPDHLVDFSNGEAVVRFDLSTLRHSTRDWVDVWITPYEEHLQLPLLDWLPDLNGPPRNAIHVTMEPDNTFRVFVYQDHKGHELPRRSGSGYEAVLTADAKRRDTFELRLSATSVRFGMPAYGLWWVDARMSPLEWTQGAVQLGHHSYTPQKDCSHGGPTGQGCRANTWHWDNVTIEPAVPFTIIPADRRYVDQDTPARLRFDRPAPADAHLRFAGIGGELEVSFDGGATWVAAERREQSKPLVDEAFGSFWTPIGQGVQEVQVRGRRWWGGTWMARDFSIWAPPSTAGPTPSPGASAVPGPPPSAASPPSPAGPAVDRPPRGTPAPRARIATCRPPAARVSSPLRWWWPWCGLVR